MIASVERRRISLRTLRFLLMSQVRRVVDRRAVDRDDEDDRDSQIYATNITCIRADWILNQQD